LEIIAGHYTLTEPVLAGTLDCEQALEWALSEDFYLRRSYLTLFLNEAGYQDSKLES